MTPKWKSAESVSEKAFTFLIRRSRYGWGCSFSPFPVLNAEVIPRPAAATWYIGGTKGGDLRPHAKAGRVES